MKRTIAYIVNETNWVGRDATPGDPAPLYEFVSSVSGDIGEHLKHFGENFLFAKEQEYDHIRYATATQIKKQHDDFDRWPADGQPPARYLLLKLGLLIIGEADHDFLIFDFETGEVYETTSNAIYIHLHTFEFHFDDGAWCAYNGEDTVSVLDPQHVAGIKGQLLEAMDIDSWPSLEAYDEAKLRQLKEELGQANSTD